MKKQDITSRLIDEIYGKIYALNDRLMRRSEKSKKNDEIYSCADIFDFYISSQAISFLKLLYTNDVHNNALYLSTRCILEGIALKNLCKQSVVGTYKEKLLQKQVFLIEYISIIKRTGHLILCPTAMPTHILTFMSRISK